MWSKNAFTEKLNLKDLPEADHVAKYRCGNPHASSVGTGATASGDPVGEEQSSSLPRPLRGSMLFKKTQNLLLQRLRLC
jgi:hypothetical protein